MKSLMQGEDMIAIAPTGSGKTLAFAIPALLKSAELNK
jgi:superfamily II DNA/RNA helicase